MQMIDIKKLNPHPKNTYFFDNMEGEPWMAFLESVETSGIIEPIVVTQDFVIVSGHQRVRACEELKIKQILAEVRVYESEDEVLKQLIETNIRQRGVGNTNAVKLGRCIKELERIYGIKQGRPEKNSNNVGNKSQDELLAELGMNKETYRQYKKVAELPEEIQQMVMDGKVTASTASRVIARMSPEEQKKFYEEFADKDKVSGRDVEYYKKRVAEQQKEIDALRNREPEVAVIRNVAVAEEIPEEITKAIEKAKKIEVDNYAEILRHMDKATERIELFIEEGMLGLTPGMAKEIITRLDKEIDRALCLKETIEHFIGIEQYEESEEK